jgi:hypothetical protein
MRRLFLANADFQEANYATHQGRHAQNAARNPAA